MTKPATTLMSQISKKHRDVVQEIFKHRGANLSRDEFFGRTKEKWITEPGNRIQYAHALAELAYWVSPKLLADFEVDRPLPWDREYYHWLRRKPRTTAYRDLSRYSSVLNRWVHDLEEPDWWRGKRYSAEEGQPKSGSREILEEDLSEQSEEVQLPEESAHACLLIRHAVPARRKDAGDAVHFLDIGRTRGSGYGPDSVAAMAPWLKCSGWAAKQPWLFLARFKGESWIHCIASKPGLVSVERLGLIKELQILTAGFDPGENQTHALFRNKGNIAAELTAAGKGEDPLGVHSFKSSVKVKPFLKRCKTVRQAVDGLFEAQGAVRRELAVVELDGLLELRGARGRAVSDKELSEIGIRYFVPITAEEDPAGVRLQAAINAGDVKAARKAIASGASLEFIPDEFRSPLSIAFDDTHPGDWRGVAKLLVEAGAPIDGYDWEESLICSPIKNLGKYEDAIIKRMEAMLSLGASIDSRGRLPAEGFTPLHLAVEKNHLQVVQFLIDKGADLDARDVYRRTPLEMAEDLASDDLEEESAGGANDEASSTEGASPQLTPLELFVSEFSRTPRERARLRIQIVKLLREVYAHRAGGSRGRPGKGKR